MRIQQALEERKKKQKEYIGYVRGQLSGHRSQSSVSQTPGEHVSAHAASDANPPSSSAQHQYLRDERSAQLPSINAYYQNYAHPDSHHAAQSHFPPLSNLAYHTPMPHSSSACSVQGPPQTIPSYVHHNHAHTFDTRHSQLPHNPPAFYDERVGTQYQMPQSKVQSHGPVKTSTSSGHPSSVSYIPPNSNPPAAPSHRHRDEQPRAAPEEWKGIPLQNPPVAEKRSPIQRVPAKTASGVPTPPPSNESVTTRTEEAPTFLLQNTPLDNTYAFDRTLWVDSLGRDSNSSGKIQAYSPSGYSDFKKASPQKLSRIEQDQKRTQVVRSRRNPSNATFLEWEKMSGITSSTEEGPSQKTEDPIRDQGKLHQASCLPGRAAISTARTPIRTRNHNAPEIYSVTPASAPDSILHKLSESPSPIQDGKINVSSLHTLQDNLRKLKTPQATTTPGNENRSHSHTPHVDLQLVPKTKEEHVATPASGTQLTSVIATPPQVPNPSQAQNHMPPQHRQSLRALPYPPTAFSHPYHPSASYPAQTNPTQPGCACPHCFHPPYYYAPYPMPYVTTSDNKPSEHGGMNSIHPNPTQYVHSSPQAQRLHPYPQTYIVPELTSHAVHAPAQNPTAPQAPTAVPITMSAPQSTQIGEKQTSASNRSRSVVSNARSLVSRFSEGSSESRIPVLANPPRSVSRPIIASGANNANRSVRNSSTNERQTRSKSAAPTAPRARKHASDVSSNPSAIQNTDKQEESESNIEHSDDENGASTRPVNWDVEPVMHASEWGKGKLTIEEEERRAAVVRRKEYYEYLRKRQTTRSSSRRPPAYFVQPSVPERRNASPPPPPPPLEPVRQTRTQASPPATRPAPVPVHSTPARSHVSEKIAILDKTLPESLSLSLREQQIKASLLELDDMLSAFTHRDSDSASYQTQRKDPMIPAANVSKSNGIYAAPPPIPIQPARQYVQLPDARSISIDSELISSVSSPNRQQRSASRIRNPKPKVDSNNPHGTEVFGPRKYPVLPQKHENASNTQNRPGSHLIYPNPSSHQLQEQKDKVVIYGYPFDATENVGVPVSNAHINQGTHGHVPVGQQAPQVSSPLSAVIARTKAIAHGSRSVISGPSDHPETQAYANKKDQMTQLEPARRDLNAGVVYEYVPVQYVPYPAQLIHPSHGNPTVLQYHPQPHPQTANMGVENEYAPAPHKVSHIAHTSDHYVRIPVGQKFPTL